MKIKEIIHYLESLAPLSLQESYDNSGLIIGDKQLDLSGVLISLDCTEAVVDEAIALNCNLIISHHPILFKGLKSLTGKNYVERTLLKAIKNDIAIYAIHTNLDNYRYGVNAKIGDLLGIKEAKILSPNNNSLNKLIVYTPIKERLSVLNALFNAGAGTIGNYSECSFTSNGEGTFMAGEKAQPYVGELHSRHSENESKLEVIVSNHKLNEVINALLKVHPYEEVAYDIIPLKNMNRMEGAGMYGELLRPVNSLNFLHELKTKFNCGIIRHTAIIKDQIQRIAWCGGSGSFLLSEAKKVSADIFITGDYKYHDFFDADNQLIIADIGHFESEQFTVNLIAELLAKKFTNFAAYLSKINTNPIKYL